MNPFESIQNLPLFHSITNAMAVAVIALDENRSIFWANQVACEQFELLSPAVSFDELLVDPGRVEDGNDWMRPGKSLLTRCRSTGGKTFWAQIDFRPINHDGKTLTVLTILDVTSQRLNEERLLREASTDSLSGLANRSQFQKVLENSLGSAISLAILDIDFFKDVNDTLGHVVGDDVLAFVANHLTQVFPESLCVARLGGDEFGVLMLSTDTRKIVDSLKDLQRSLDGESKEKFGIRVRVSVGIAIGLRGSLTARELLSTADLAMYESKSAGRNRITCKVLD